MMSIVFGLFPDFPFLFFILISKQSARKSRRKIRSPFCSYKTRNNLKADSRIHSLLYYNSICLFYLLVLLGNIL